MKVRKSLIGVRSEETWRWQGEPEGERGRYARERSGFLSKPGATPRFKHLFGRLVLLCHDKAFGLIARLRVSRSGFREVEQLTLPIIKWSQSWIAFGTQRGRWQRGSEIVT